MKSFFNSLFLASAMMMSGIMMVSCDEDQITSNILSGDWEGDFGMYYEYAYGHRVYTFESYDTELSFFPEYDYAKFGYGYQVDYYDFGPYEKIYHYFRWNVDHQNIYLTYKDEVDLNTVIRRYKMSNDKFTGYFGDSQSKFCLFKMADYYNWDTYDDCGDYYYYDRYDWYGRWAPATRGIEDDGSAVVPDNDIPKTEAPDGVLRFGNRFEDAAK